MLTQGKLKYVIKEINSFTENQLSVPAMVQIIKSKIIQDETLKLLRIGSSSSFRIIPPTLGKTRIGLEQTPSIFAHPIELEIEGNYIRTYELLKTLEKSWRIYWDSIEYTVLEHPNAKISLKLHLISTTEGLDED